jgi:hypothetical protein
MPLTLTMWVEERLDVPPRFEWRQDLESHPLMTPNGE